MAKLSKKLQSERLWKEYTKAKDAGKKPKFPTRVYNRCALCGRIHGYMRKFKMCRICFRERACNGSLMGIKKSSW